MGSTKIEWTWHKCEKCGTIIKGWTFNVVWGCTEVSPECDNCYARTLANRYGFGWGNDAERRVMSKQYWKNPLKWQKEVEALGTYGFVFCSSMADVFESHPVVDEERKKLWPLIKATPNLVWLLLTKRASNIKRMLPDDWGAGYPNV